MIYQNVNAQAIHLCGLSSELTTSHHTNQMIISKQWQHFNQTLNTHKIQLGTDWKKYGVTLKIEQRYVYITAIASDVKLVGFESFQIHAGEYLHFQHLGSMDLMKFTLNRIYKTVIAQSSIQLNPSRQLIHFEMYNHQFRWNHVDSVIHIYVPILK